VEAHRHTRPKGYITLSRSGRPELFPAVHGVCPTSKSGDERGEEDEAEYGLHNLTDLSVWNISAPHGLIPSSNVPESRASHSTPATERP
jgi:hypothetical protein